MVKIGRNDPCPCGKINLNGRPIKYKKCCLDQDLKAQIPQEVIEHFQRIKMQENFRHKAGIRVPFVKPVLFQGKKIWALGNRILSSPNIDATFHEFIIGTLADILGEEWWKKESKQVPTEQHFIYKCFEKFTEWKNRNLQSGQKVGDMWGAVPDGWSKSLLSIAWDVCTLLHAQSFPTSLLNRLKNKDEYQGARYEISIAALFARLGYKIEWQEGKDRHCEFFARNADNQIYAIEVKSKHHEGVLHTKGTRKNESLGRAKIKWLLKDALKQNPGGVPFVIFIDLNIPTTPSIPADNKNWMSDIQKAINNSTRNQDQNSVSAFFITNFSYHYEELNHFNPGEYVGVLPENPEYSIPLDTISDIKSALDNYGYVPNYDVDEREKLIPI